MKRLAVLATCITLNGCAAIHHPPGPASAPNATVSFAPTPPTATTPRSPATPPTLTDAPQTPSRAAPPESAPTSPTGATEPISPPPASTTGPPAPTPRTVPVGEIPPDLDTPTAHSLEPDDEAASLETGDDELATAWVLARSLTRFDDAPASRHDRLAALCDDPTIVDAATARADPTTGGATWAVVAAVTALGSGWWQVAYTLKATGDGQVGPTSTPSTLDVRVVDRRVVGERQ